MSGAMDTVRCIRGQGPDRERLEKDLVAANVPLPLQYRLSWQTGVEATQGIFFGLFDEAGRCTWGCEAIETPTRALPGHHTLRIHRFGAGASKASASAVAEAIVDKVMNTPRIVRTSLDVFSFDPEKRSMLDAAVLGAGFSPALEGPSYLRTVIVDLAPSEEALFSGLHSTARRHLRATDRADVEVRPIVDPADAGRVEELIAQAMSRTGGTPSVMNWDGVIRYSNAHPDLSRIVGIYRTDEEGPEALLGFAHGMHHGDSVEYAGAGSDRRTDLKLPLGYGPAWDLILWAKRSGAPYFDFGGITLENDGDPALKGISRFKRYFTKEMLEVRREYVLYPPGARASIARAVSTGAAYVRRSRRLRRAAQPPA